MRYRSGYGDAFRRVGRVYEILYYAVLTTHVLEKAAAPILERKPPQKKESKKENNRSHTHSAAALPFLTFILSFVSAITTLKRKRKETNKRSSIIKSHFKSRVAPKIFKNQFVSGRLKGRFETFDACPGMHSHVFIFISIAIRQSDMHQCESSMNLTACYYYYELITS